MQENSCHHQSRLGRSSQTTVVEYSDLENLFRCLLGDARNLKKTLSGLDVSHGICL